MLYYIILFYIIYYIILYYIILYYIILYYIILYIFLYYILYMTYDLDNCIDISRLTIYSYATYVFGSALYVSTSGPVCWRNCHLRGLILVVLMDWRTEEHIPFQHVGTHTVLCFVSILFYIVIKCATLCCCVENTSPPLFRMGVVIDWRQEPIHFLQEPRGGMWRCSCNHCPNRMGRVQNL